MTLWELARAAGLAALLLLTASTCLGALTTGRGHPAGRVVAQYVHRATASLGLGVLALHVSTILADSYAGVGWRGALVPFRSGYRPTWVALGSLAAYTFVLVAALGIARGRFAASVRAAAAWRWMHALAYVGWGAAMLHGFESGTDSSLGWVRLLYVLCGLAVGTCVAVRVGLARRPDLVRASAVLR